MAGKNDAVKAWHVKGLMDPGPPGRQTHENIYSGSLIDRPSLLCNTAFFRGAAGSGRCGVRADPPRSGIHDGRRGLRALCGGAGIRRVESVDGAGAVLHLEGFLDDDEPLRVAQLPDSRALDQEDERG